MVRSEYNRDWGEMSGILLKRLAFSYPQRIYSTTERRAARKLLTCYDFKLTGWWKYGFRGRTKEGSYDLELAAKEYRSIGIPDLEGDVLLNGRKIGRILVQDRKKERHFIQFTCSQRNYLLTAEFAENRAASDILIKESGENTLLQVHRRFPSFMELLSWPFGFGFLKRGEFTPRMKALEVVPALSTGVLAVFTVYDAYAEAVMNDGF